MVIARILRRLLLALVLATASWLTVFVYRGETGIAVGGAFALALSHAWVLAFEFACSSVVNRADVAPKAQPGLAVRAWLHEVVTDVLVFGWRQAFRSDQFPDRLRPTGRRGVLLVHGFFCNRGVFNPWLHQLGAAEVPFIAVDLDQPFGAIDDQTRTLETAVQNLRRTTGLKPIVVAHSMGGLVVRAWLDRCGADGELHHVITVGTPHHGTWLARLSRRANVRQMRRGSDWLTALAAREPSERRSRFTCFYSNCDNVVFPASTATLPGADNRHLPGLAHVEMLYDARVLAEAMRWLDTSAGGSLSAEGAVAKAR